MFLRNNLEYFVCFLLECFWKLLIAPFWCQKKINIELLFPANDAFAFFFFLFLDQAERSKLRTGVKLYQNRLGKVEQRRREFQSVFWHRCVCGKARYRRGGVLQNCTNISSLHALCWEGRERSRRRRAQLHRMTVLTVVCGNRCSGQDVRCFSPSSARNQNHPVTHTAL